ncbi:homeobox-leucine zipper protein ATHB-17-like isoform X2 [Benincasa hispida]|uniref:homeobox-leucine zipper protein ATHB-17-like isoform X2 n=1 Tax=Benincasa hispida TaxID=102211 RepID=UPI001902B01C|nr:homeobox-leucine zipper protein ATHB-17-like isoform X2 [Benincasa hispida]
MAIFPINSSNLDLSISMPGFASPPTRSSFAGEAEVEEWAVAPSAEEEEEEESCTNNGGTQPRKKLRLSKDQSRLLEASFRLNHTLNPKQKEALAMELKLKPRQVEVWFQNRRARSKLKQTEIECEYLKRWFRSLTEQNRWLRRELEELRAIKVAPPAIVSRRDRQPPLSTSTITMCPRCERITSTKAAVTETAIAATTMSSKVVLSALKLR